YGGTRPAWRSCTRTPSRHVDEDVLAHGAVGRDPHARRRREQPARVRRAQRVAAGRELQDEQPSSLPKGLVSDNPAGPRAGRAQRAGERAARLLRAAHDVGATLHVDPGHELARPAREHRLMGRDRDRRRAARNGREQPAERETWQHHPKTVLRPQRRCDGTAHVLDGRPNYASVQMAPRHLDRLSTLDASFLHQEGPETHMHIGALAIVDGPAPGLDELLATIGSRLHRVPRYRQRLAHAPFDRGRPVWIDDPGFRLEFHVRGAALPNPGGHEQLLAMLAQIFSAQLDRRRPLWELWFIEGLHDDRFALIFKAHHAVTDGVAGVDLATLVLDREGERDERARDWTPARSPSAAELVALAATRDAQAAVRLFEHALAAAMPHRQAAARRCAALDGVGEVVRATLDPAPAPPLNVPIGPYRRFVSGTCRLADIR